MRTIVEHGNLTAQHAVRIIIEHEVLLVGIVAEYGIQAIAQVFSGISYDGLLQLYFLIAKQGSAPVFEGMRTGFAIGVGQRDGDGVLFPGNKAEYLEFMGFAVLRLLVGVTGEIRVAVRMHGIGYGYRVVGGEIHIQRRGVGAVRILSDEHVIFRGGRLAFFLLELVVGHILIVGCVHILDTCVQPFDPVLSDGRIDVVIAGETDAQCDDRCYHGRGPASNTRMVRQKWKRFHS